MYINYVIIIIYYYHHYILVLYLKTSTVHKPIGQWSIVCIVENWACSIEAKPFNASNIEIRAVPSDTDRHREMTLITVIHWTSLLVVITNTD